MNDKHSDSYGMEEDLQKEGPTDPEDFSEGSSTQPEPLKPQKGKRGRKIKYLTDEERIEARRTQQKAYRERKKTEIEQLKARIAAVEDFIKDLVKEHNKEHNKE